MTQQGMTQPALGELNLYDLVSLRHTNRNLLQSTQNLGLAVAPVNPPVNHPWYPHHGPGPIRIPRAVNQINPVLINFLGARCDEWTNQGATAPAQPCTNVQDTNVQMKPCETASPLNHPPGTHNVCNRCLYLHSYRMGRRVRRDLLPNTKAIYCKECSLILRARYPNGGINRCVCVGAITGDWNCKDCQKNRFNRAIGMSDDRKDVLLRTHKKRVGRWGSRTIVSEVLRKEMACPTNDCGGKPWLRSGPSACYMCTICAQTVVP